MPPEGGKVLFKLYSFYIGNAAANVVTNGIILLVPIPLVWKLQMGTTKKALVTGIFFLGGFVCVASIVRIHFMTFLKDSHDITWIMGDVFIWSSVEHCIGIVCACLLTLQPLPKSLQVPTQFQGHPYPSMSQKITSGSKHNKKFLSGSDRFPHLNQEDAHFRQHDKAMLTTFATHVELDTIERASDGDDSSKDLPTGITVKKNFQWTEQRA